VRGIFHRRSALAKYHSTGRNASSEAPVSGSYRFTVSVDLNIDRATRYVAKLSLVWDGQATSCVKNFGV
jgi:hypothetical protein